MSDRGKRYSGGCLCGALRYEAKGEPLFAGHCYCADCRKASGSGFIPFMGFASSAVQFSGQTRIFRSKAARRAQFLSDLRQPRLRWRGRQERPAHDLRGLPERPIVLPTDDRDLHPQPSDLGCHTAGPDDLRSDALLIRLGKSDKIAPSKPHAAIGRPNISQCPHRRGSVSVREQRPRVASAGRSPPSGRRFYRRQTSA
jgi:hypothetical protein